MRAFKHAKNKAGSARGPVISCQQALNELILVLVDSMNGFKEAGYHPTEWCAEKLKLKNN
jgi:hypothetical protein